MQILRLAYTTQFLLALLAVFVLWSQVGGQTHLDLMPWYLKLVLGGGAAFAIVKATAGAVAHERVWNAKTLRWVGILLAVLIGCGFATYYVHLYGEPDDEQDDESLSSFLIAPARPVGHATLLCNAQADLAGSGGICGTRLVLGPRRASPGGAAGAGDAQPRG